MLLPADNFSEYTCIASLSMQNLQGGCIVLQRTVCALLSCWHIPRWAAKKVLMAINNSTSTFIINDSGVQNYDSTVAEHKHIPPSNDLLSVSQFWSLIYGSFDACWNLIFLLAASKPVSTGRFMSRLEGTCGAITSWRIFEYSVLFSGVWFFSNTGQFDSRVSRGDPGGEGLDLWKGLFWCHVIKTIPAEKPQITILLSSPQPALTPWNDFLHLFHT